MVGTACEEHAFANPTKLPLPPLFGELVLGLVAADEDQDAGDQGQHGADRRDREPGAPEAVDHGVHELAIRRTCLLDILFGKFPELLRDIEGLSTSETGEGLGLGDEAVKTRLHRARAMIRRAVTVRIGEVAAGAFQFHAPRCDRVVSAVLARVAECS